MKAALLLVLPLIACLGLVACQGTSGGSTVPSDLFWSESKPVGDGSTDPYRPETVKPLIDIPAEPPPSGNRPPHPGKLK